MAVENLPDTRGYATSDLFIRHPTKDYLWKMYDFPFSRQVEKLINSFLHFDSVGRIDDVVIHSSGEKTVPAPIEDIVMSST